MATRPITFTAIPDIQLTGLSDWQYHTLTAMKENLDLLTGAGGDGAESAAALTRASITIDDVPDQTMTKVEAIGAGYTISGQQVPDLADYVTLITNVQQLANDVATLQSYVNALIAQLRA
jgi:hypothetical protein